MKAFLLFLLSCLTHITKQDQFQFVREQSDLLQLHDDTTAAATSSYELPVQNNDGARRRLQSEIIFQDNNHRLESVTDNFVAPFNTQELQDYVSVAIIGKNSVVGWISQHLINTGILTPCTMVQVFDELGNRISAETKVNPVGQVTLGIPFILRVTDEKFMLLWAGTEGETNIYGRFFDANGTPEGGDPVKISDQPLFNSIYAPHGDCSTNQCIITWHASLPVRDINTIDDIKMKRIYLNGTKIVNETTVNLHTLDNQAFSKVLIFENENYAIFWLDSRGGRPNSETDIYAQFFDKYNNRLFTQDLKINVYTYPVLGTTAMAVVKLDGNRGILVWQGTSIINPGASTLFYRIINSDGTLVGSAETEVNPSSTLQKIFPDVRLLPGNILAILWSSYLDLQTMSVNAQLFQGSTFLPLTGELQLSNGTAASVFYPKMDVSGTHMIVGWRSDTQDSNNGYDIFARLFGWIIPTQSPTNLPSVTPTYFPTKMPTTISPTTITLHPSSSPTKSPTTKFHTFWKKNGIWFYIGIGGFCGCSLIVVICYLGDKFEKDAAHTTAKNIRMLEMVK